MYPEDCPNKGMPCLLHDHPEDWHIVIGKRRVHQGWLIAVVVLLIALSAYPGLN